MIPNLTPPPNGPEYVAYYRVSTKKQGDSGLGLDAQQAYIAHFYQHKHMIAAFTDIKSGKAVTGRLELQKALALCKLRRATLVVAKVDRLSRDTEDALQIYRELEGRLESCDIPNLDKFTLTLFMAIADRERVLIRLRTQQALVELLKRRGQWRRASEPFQNGLATQKANAAVRENARQNRHNRRAITLIGRLRAEGCTYAQIARQLNEAGFQASRGGLFRAEQVRRLLLRPLDELPPENG
ncbi:recombinase family protein [Spirosoma utsteinense]|uniref:recombinase family protein n=1 Tax=Spirosoma utsteinense TaxID=2585773 RepID=UPI001648EB58|nr:recombinase family protein [Spirosoma utsteinense]MBC3789278.1 DNA invertase Pin-like site-specific DNA recombinase [Spirosoma utsteinense]